MSDVTRILAQIEMGERAAAEQLLPLVYDELRKLAAARLAHEKPGQTLQATALVHEAYLRLVGPAGPAGPKSPIDAAPRSHPAVGTYTSRNHFFAAAAEAMRRILVDQSRRKQTEKHGGHGQRFELSEADGAYLADADTVLSIDEALARLAGEDAASADVARLRLFAGLSVEEAAEALGVSRATAFRDWSYARAWLAAALDGDQKSGNP